MNMMPKFDDDIAAVEPNGPVRMDIERLVEWAFAT